jgi:hypothetical protein
VSEIRHTHKHWHGPGVLDCYAEHNGGVTHTGPHTHASLGAHNHDGSGHTPEQLAEAGGKGMSVRIECFRCGYVTDADGTLTAKQKRQIAICLEAACVSHVGEPED